MGFTDPLDNYEDLLEIILLFHIAFALIIGIFYIWRYKKTDAIITLLWALGFTGVGIGLLINYLINYTYHDYFVDRLPITWDYSLFNRIGVLSITSALTLSVFYIGEIKEKYSKIGIIIFGSMAYCALICLIITTYAQFNLYPIASWIIRILSLWVILFFTYLSIKSRNYRMITLTIGFISATVGGILMAQFYGTPLGLIGNIFQFDFYGFIAFGLFFTRHWET